MIRRLTAPRRASSRWAAWRSRGVTTIRIGSTSASSSCKWGAEMTAPASRWPSSFAAVARVSASRHRNRSRIGPRFGDRLPRSHPDRLQVEHAGRALRSRLPGRAPLRTRADSDFTIALLDAWAVALDILSFYQERIANESYLRTAVDQRSVIELARLVGYKPSPGVAASAFLAFTLSSTRPARPTTC